MEEVSKMPSEVTVSIYLSRKEIEQALRQWLTKNGHGKRIAGLDLAPIETDWQDGEFHVLFGDHVNKEDWDE
jgi:hypothetical protein